MKNIDEIRSALSRINNGRFSISKQPPVFPVGINDKKTTIISEGSLWSGKIGEPVVKDADTVRLNPYELESIYERLDDAVARLGVDALAWYVSFHNSADEWGVYIPMRSVHYLADRLFSDLIADRDRRVNLALSLLLHHELFHFHSDYAQTQFELLLGMPCRFQLSSSFTGGGYLEIEEALANAYMLRELQKELKSREFEKVKQFVLRQSAGYRDAIPYFEDSRLYNSGLDEVVKSYIGLAAATINLTMQPASISWGAFYRDIRSDVAGVCPIHFLHDDAIVGLPPMVPRLINSISDIRETRRFVKMFSKLDKRHQTAWQKTKEELSKEPLSQKQFEALKGEYQGIYSVRLNRSYRAHLKPIDKFSYWEALEIGTHTELGHD